MAVLIEGMEMPKVPGVYCLDLYVDEICQVQNMEGATFEAIEIPPHGRLIDADEMFEEFVIEGQRSKRYKIGEKWELNGEEIRGVISRLPTIIPASEEGET